MAAIILIVVFACIVFAIEYFFQPVGKLLGLQYSQAKFPADKSGLFEIQEIKMCGDGKAQLGVIIEGHWYWIFVNTPSKYQAGDWIFINYKFHPGLKIVITPKIESGSSFSGPSRNPLGCEPEERILH